jgi:hypothetical protein
MISLCRLKLTKSGGRESHQVILEEEESPKQARASTI